MSSEEVLPKLKRRLVAFIKKENGKISKQSMATMGTIIGTAAIGGVMAAKSVKAGSTTLTVYPGTVASATGSHAHHADHGDHSSHSDASFY